MEKPSIPIMTGLNLYTGNADKPLYNAKHVYTKETKGFSYAKICQIMSGSCVTSLSIVAVCPLKCRLVIVIKIHSDPENVLTKVLSITEHPI